VNSSSDASARDVSPNHTPPAESSPAIAARLATMPASE